MIDEVQKQKLIKDLEKSGNVYLACLKNYIGRATYYRWINEDKQFKNLATRAVRHGRENNVDVAEHSLMLNVKDKKMDAIKYVLSHNSPNYRPKRNSKVILEHRSIKEKETPTVTLEDVMEGMVLREEKELEERRKAAAANALPLTPDGHEIMPWDMEKYKDLIHAWRVEHNIWPKPNPLEQFVRDKSLLMRDPEDPSGSSIAPPSPETLS